MAGDGQATRTAPVLGPRPCVREDGMLDHFNPRLIPIASNSKVPPAGFPVKQYRDRPPIAEEERQWAIDYPAATNRAAPTGRANGVIVVDVDRRNGGNESMRGLAFPTTRTVMTPGSGWHYYYECPATGFPTILGVRPGIDIKGDGGYVLVPPSTINGNPYELVVDEPVAAPPEWVLAASRQRRPGPKLYTASLARVPKGQQRHHLLSLIGYLLKLPEATWSLIPPFIYEVSRSYDQDASDPWTLADVEAAFVDLAAKERRARTAQFRLRPINMPPDVLP